jgi:hypothetical protein
MLSNKYNLIPLWFNDRGVLQSTWCARPPGFSLVNEKMNAKKIPKVPPSTVLVTAIKASAMSLHIGFSLSDVKLSGPPYIT